MKGVIMQKRIIMRGEKALIRYILDIKTALQRCFYKHIQRILTYIYKVIRGGGSHVTIFNGYII